MRLVKLLSTGSCHWPIIVVVALTTVSAGLRHWQTIVVVVLSPRKYACGLLVPWPVSGFSSEFVNNSLRMNWLGASAGMCTTYCVKCLSRSTTQARTTDTYALQTVDTATLLSRLFVAYQAPGTTDTCFFTALIDWLGGWAFCTVWRDATSKVAGCFVYCTVFQIVGVWRIRVARYRHCYAIF